MQPDKRQKIMNLMDSFNINRNVITEEDMKLLEKGGYSISESSEDFGMSHDSYPHENLKESLQINQHDQIDYYRKRQQEIEMYNQMTKHNSIVSGLEKEKAYLELEIKRIQNISDIEKQKMEREFNIEKERLVNEIKKFQNREMQAQSQIPLIKEAFGQVRDMLNGQIPETIYLKLRDLPEQDLLPSEWVLVNVWDLAYPFKKEQEKQRLEIFNLRDEIKNMNTKSYQQLTEIEHANKLLFDKDEDYKRHCQNYENNRKQLQQELDRLNEELAQLRDKHQSYDLLQRDFKLMEQEKYLLEQKIGFFDNSKKEGSPVSEFFEQQKDMQRKMDILNHDKEYLTKENIQLLEKNKSLEDRFDRIEKELIQAKDQAQQYLFQLLNQKSNFSSDYQDRINKELNELKEKHNFELESQKNNLVEIYERQLRFLKEAKDELDLKLEASTAQIREKQFTYDQLMVDNRNLSKKVESDLGELRLQYRIKSEELERIQGIYEDTLANLKSAKLENNMLTEKLNVLKSEYYKMEVSQKEDFVNLKAQLAVTKEQLLNYESIEKEVDEAVMQMSSDYNESSHNNVYLNALHMAPTSSKRRIQQALQLAKRLQIKQKENEENLIKIKQLQDQLEQSQEELKVARDLVDKSNQPYAYLISSIEEKETEVLKFKQLLRKNEQNQDYLKQENSDLKSQNEKLENDLKKLLIKRENIHNIQTLLLNLVNNNDQEVIKGSADKVLQDIKYILDSKALQSNYNIENQMTFQPPHQQQLSKTQKQYQKQMSPPSKDTKPQWFQTLKKVNKK